MARTQRVPLKEENDALLRAIRKGNDKRAKYILNSVSLCIPDLWHDGYMPLKEAIIHKRIDLAKFLLAIGAKLKLSKEESSDLLCYATGTRDLDFIKILLRHDSNQFLDVNTCEKIYGETPLYLAVQNLASDECSWLDVDIINELLKLKPDPNNESNRQSLVLLLAHVYSSSSQKCLIQSVVNNLLDYGFKLKSSDVQNRDLLYGVIAKGHKQFLETLLSLGADPDTIIVENLQETLLYVALLDENYDSASTLLRHGANINHRNARGETLLILFISTLDKSLSGYANQISYLLENGVDLNAESRDGKTAIDLCLDLPHSHSSTYIVKKLFNHGVDLYAVDKNGDLLFYRAMKRKHLVMVMTMIARGVSLNERFPNGLTPLQMAVFELKCMHLTKCLCQSGADIDVLDDHDKTLLHTAMADKNEELCRILLECDIDITVKDRQNKLAIDYLPKDDSASGILQMYQKFALEQNMKMELLSRSLDDYLPYSKSKSPLEILEVKIWKQVKRMRFWKICKNVSISIHDILSHSDYDLSKFFRHNKLVEKKGKFNFDDFEFYRVLLKRRMIDVKAYPDLMKEGLDALKVLVNYRLHDYALFEIVQYLRAKDIRRILHALDRQ